MYNMFIKVPLVSMTVIGIVYEQVTYDTQRIQTTRIDKTLENIKATILHKSCKTHNSSVLLCTVTCKITISISHSYTHYSSIKVIRITTRGHYKTKSHHSI